MFARAMASARSITVRFRLEDARGHAIAASWAAALAKAGWVRVLFIGPGVPEVTPARCTWKAATGYFQCWVKVPSRIKAGSSFVYVIRAEERLGMGFFPVPALGKIVNPEKIHFR